MTEEQWLACEDPRPMLQFLKGKMSDRRLRLFGCSICNLLAPFVTFQAYKRGIELAESYADGKGTKAALKRQRLVLNERASYLLRARGIVSVEHNPLTQNEYNALVLAILALSENNYRTFPGHLSDLLNEPRNNSTRGSIREILRSICGLIRCVFSNPFHPITLDPSWLNSTVLALAQQMYESRDFSAMPILADALQDAGCDDDDILNHCREPREHVKGCWCVDLILGKQ